MGGYFAYWMAKKLGAPTILFNPALHERSVSVNADKSGKRTPQQTIILGVEDTVVDPQQTIEWLEKNEKRSDYGIEWANQGHRTTYSNFTKAFKKYG
jgi:predicted esterase YcpF (UPF0227 family)